MTRALPHSWRPDLRALLPADPAHRRVPPVAAGLTSAFLGVTTARSLVHLLAQDGGAHRIATIDLDVAGGPNIVAMFGQWGASQLLLAVVLWTLRLRYRGLIPLVVLILCLEPPLRALSGHRKPLTTVGTAPGAVANRAVVPFLVATLWLSLCQRER